MNEVTPDEDGHTVDVLVVGTGCSGMSAAVTAASKGLQVLVVEKEPRFGGTTARSGGWLWIPNTRLAAEQGLAEPAGAARTYLQHEATTHFDAERVDAFLEHGPQAIDFFTRNTCVQFDMPPVFPDYHAEAPGGQPGGRSMVTRPFDGHELGPRIRQLGMPLPELTVFGMMLGSGKEIWHFMRAFKSLESFVFVAQRLARHALDVLRHGRGMTLTNGNALAGRLAKAAMDLKVPVWLQSPVKALIVEGGVVRGAWVERDGARTRVLARRGVVLACGGFPADAALRQRYYAHVGAGKNHRTAAPADNTGDALQLAQQAGVSLKAAQHHPAAWTPMSLVPQPDGSDLPFPHYNDRGKAGYIAVDRRGRRFISESRSYHDFVPAMIEACRDDAEVCSWVVCDGRAIRRYGLGRVPPWPLPIGSFVSSGYLKRGQTLDELAQACGIDAAGLRQTVARLNAGASQGIDEEFNKGADVYERFNGSRGHAPNPCVAPIDTAPFYAVKVVPGDIGSFVGLQTDEHARALDAQRRPIDGLYVAGNDAGSFMGGTYPGAGITLGPAMVFGHIAARHALQRVPAA